jgi:hypothetical protein
MRFQRSEIAADDQHSNLGFDIPQQARDLRNRVPLGIEVLRLVAPPVCASGSDSSPRSFRSRFLPTHPSALSGTPRSPGRSGSSRLCRFPGIERRCCGDCAIAAGGHIVGEIDDAHAGQT